MAAHKRMRRKAMSQINVVPYIDVMLVLLVIFMVTAPMLQEGVDVDLPQAVAKPIETKEDEARLVIAVNANGEFYIDEEGKDARPLAAQELAERVAAMLESREDKQVYVRGDQSVGYGRVVEAMVALQQAGASSVGLITEQPDRSR